MQRMNKDSNTDTEAKRILLSVRHPIFLQYRDVVHQQQITLTYHHTERMPFLSVCAHIRACTHGAMMTFRNPKRSRVLESRTAKAL